MSSALEEASATMGADAMANLLACNAAEPAGSDRQRELY